MNHKTRTTPDAFANPPSSLFDDELLTNSESTDAGAIPSISAPTTGRGVPRVKRPIRDQVEMRMMCVDDLVSLDDQVRAVWEFVMMQDLSSLYDNIAAVEGEVGRDAIDPRILMALWLFATIDGVGSAREIARLTMRDNPYQWICGGVSVNHDLLSRFRAGAADVLDDVLTMSVAVLMQQNLVDLKRVAQDGIRVRANASKSSFRREKTLQELHAVAVEHLASLKTAVHESPSQASARQKAARLHVAKDRENRIAKAVAAVPKLKAAREKRKKGDGETTRVSTTDVEARVMKMANGGFNPAFNVQFATDTESGVIVGVEVSSEGTDAGLMLPMMNQIHERHGEIPEEILVDGGYMMAQDTIAVTQMEAVIYMPVQQGKRKLEKGIDPYAPIRDDSPEVAAWRQRMGRPESKEIYKERASTAEWVNAQARNRGLQQFRVRGRKKVKNVAMLFAIVHNLLQGLSLYRNQPEVAIS